MILVGAFVFIYTWETNPDKMIYHHIQMYAGDFDYSTNDIIYFANESGFGAIRFSDGEIKYDGAYMDSNCYIPDFHLDGYNFSLLNQSAKCVNIYLDDYWNGYEWSEKLNRVILTFYDKDPETYSSESLTCR